MGATAGGQTTATMDEKLAAYWDLVEKREALEARLRKAESEKSSVSPRIYEKVTEEYQNELRAIADKLEPVKDALEDARKEVERAIEDIDLAARAIGEQLSEATFRHKVGEFTTEEYKAVVEKHRPDVEALKKRRAECEAHLENFDRRRSRERAPEPPKAEPPKAEAPKTEAPKAETPKAAAPEPAPATKPEAATKTKDAPDFVDPSNWFDDNGGDDADTKPAAAATKKSASKKKDDDDPLAALADPSEGADRGATYPSLLIKSGPYAGRVLPLLPMTMSIGREHDNNIELKDPEVARYHARIVYERGQFAIEDLESSTGTFVNDQRTRRAQLAEGDVIKIGATELSITYE